MNTKRIECRACNGSGYILTSLHRQMNFWEMLNHTAEQTCKVCNGKAYQEVPDEHVGFISKTL